MTNDEKFVSTHKLIVERLLGSDQMEKIRSQIENYLDDSSICISYEKKISLRFGGSTTWLRFPNRLLSNKSPVRVYERCHNHHVIFLYGSWDQLFAWRWKVLAMCLIDLPRILAKIQRNVCIEIRDP